MYRTAAPGPFSEPNSWTWFTSGVFNLTDALTNRNGKWNNVIFQNFIWGQEDQMKVECEYTNNSNYFYGCMSLYGLHLES